MKMTCWEHTVKIPKESMHISVIFSLEPEMGRTHYHATLSQWDTWITTFYLPQVSPSTHFFDQLEKKKMNSLLLCSPIAYAVILDKVREFTNYNMYSIH